MARRPPSPDPTIFLEDSDEEQPIDCNETIVIDEEGEDEDEVMDVSEDGEEIMAMGGEEEMGTEEEPSVMEVMTEEMSGLSLGSTYVDSSIEILEGSDEEIDGNDDIIDLSSDSEPEIVGEGGQEGEETTHDACSVACLKGGEQLFDRGVLTDSTTSPLLVPILCGWQRKKKRRQQARSGRQRRVVVYFSPCGRALRHLSKINDFLQCTHSDLTIDLFSFSFGVDETASFSFDFRWGICRPITVVNETDGDAAPGFEYKSSRFPLDGRVQLSSKEFCSGCNCTDDCTDASTCACQKLTYEESNNSSRGYSGKRLAGHVVSGIFECNEHCSCSKKRCLNRVVQQGITAPLQVYKTKASGWGVRCLVDLPRGSFVCSLTGPLMTDEMAEEFEGDQEYFADLDSCSLCTLGKFFEGDGVTKLFILNVKSAGNIGRLLNHSCAPNTFSQHVFLESHDPRLPHVAFFAKRDVKAGEEINFDYGWVPDAKSPRGLICHCGSSNCRGVLL